MYLKDYYSILNISPSASRDDIKKAYRLLAQQLHPDKTKNDPHTNARFREIKEAYEVLSHPARKKAYLDQRWYAQSQGRKQKAIIITPEHLLTESLALDKQMAHTDQYRFNRHGLFLQLREVLNDETLTVLATFNDTDIFDTAGRLVLKNGRMLPAADFAEIINRIGQLPISSMFKQELPAIQQQHRNRERWEKLTPWLVFLAVLITCAILFFIQH